MRDVVVAWNEILSTVSSFEPMYEWLRKHVPNRYHICCVGLSFDRVADAGRFRRKWLR